MPKRQYIPLIIVLLSATLSGPAQADEIRFEKIWKLTVGGAVHGGVRLDESRLYAGSEDGKLLAFDKSSGKAAGPWESRRKRPEG